ncbi:MAG: Glucose 1-dehydrogenase 1 [Parcubacteria group bacterium GW2011_GWB1_57_6]|nr:MAG: Glucose 1-dehydrogenase 1 [Parcubacteria group bacterium GW2011_GWB1_57_6]
MNDMNADPLAIISGGTGYLGTTIVAELKEAGWSVVSLSKNTSESSAEVYTCDVTDEKDVQAVIAKIVAAHGPISACIHAASPSLERLPVLSISAESFDVTMHTNVRAAFLLAKETVKHMPEGSAYIGVTTQAIEPGMLQPSGAYIPAKYALRGFLRVLSAETKQLGIRVFAVSPSFLPGGLNDDLPQNVQDFLANKSGTDKQSTREIATLIKKLCLHEGGFLSGSSIAFPSLASSPL